MGNTNIIHDRIYTLVRKLFSELVALFGIYKQRSMQQKKCFPAEKQVFSVVFGQGASQPLIQQGQTSQQLIQQKNTTSKLNKNQLSNSPITNSILSKLTIQNPSSPQMLFPLKNCQLSITYDKDDHKSKDQHSDNQCESDLSDLDVYDSDIQDNESKEAKTLEDKDKISEESMSNRQLALASNKSDDKEKNEKKSPISQIEAVNKQKAEKSEKARQIMDKEQSNLNQVFSIKHKNSDFQDSK